MKITSLTLAATLLVLTTFASAQEPGAVTLPPAPSALASNAAQSAATPTINSAVTTTSISTERTTTTSARERRQAIFMVGHPKRGYGTAFVIDKKRRLLVTNAHVADHFHHTGKMYAIMNGTTSTYKVHRTWYHPGVVRMIGNSIHQLAISSDPADGQVYVCCPDVAIVQLSDEGGDLPVELQLATPIAVNDLFAVDVSMMGFPGKSHVWPELGVAPNATFETGVINRVTNFQRGGSELSQKRQFVQHDIDAGAGSSGAPIFNKRGEVVAVNNSQTTEERFAIRADAVWETLAFHGILQQFGGGVSTSELNVERFKVVDPKLKSYRFVAAKCIEADKLNAAGKYAEAAKLCNEVLAKQPNNPFAHYARAVAFLDYAATWSGKISTQKNYEQQLQALSDIRVYIKHVPSNINANFIEATAIVNLAMLEGRLGKLETAKNRSRDVLPYLNKLLKSRGMTANQYVGLYQSRATAKRIVGDIKGGSADLDEAVRIFPNNSQAYLNRAHWLQHVLSRSDLATVDRKQAGVLRAKGIS